MKKVIHSIMSLILMALLAAPLLGNAIDTTTSGRILDNFKEKQEEILFDSSPLGIQDAKDILEQEYAMKGLDALKARLQGMEQAYTVKKDAITEVRVSLENTLKQLDTSIASTQTAISDTTLSVLLKQQKIQKLEADGIALQSQISQRRKIILSYLANIYSEGNSLLDVHGNIDIIKGMILTSGTTDEVLSDITYKTLVAQMGQKFVNEYREMTRSYYLLSLETQEEMKNLKELQSNLVVQKENLLSQKDEREKLLEITGGQEALYMQYIAAQQKAQQQIDAMWQQANDKYQDAFNEMLTKYNCGTSESSTQRTSECSRIRQYFINEKELAKSELPENTSNIFDWPVLSRHVTTFFRDPGYYRFLHSQHDAIDIGTPQGSDIVAPADGYVIFSLEPTPSGYSYMALRHKDGYVTVYGHLSEILVSKYEFVKKGQLIAKSGGAPGTPGAGPMTSGAHLHFEIWKNREPVDPLRYLSLTSLEYAELPSVYQDKFISDLIQESGSGTQISGYKKKFRLVGESESERQQNLLKTYATPDFQDWNMWVDASLESRLDPSFMMCVGLAETTLGNHLKTPYNIGNIGNTDDGGTYTFSSPREGIEWMARTFNNKYLGSYTKLSQLSRWGNPDGPIYASSSGNWHTNIIRCMSALKGEFVDDNVAFRINIESTR